MRGRGLLDVRSNPDEGAMRGRGLPDVRSNEVADWRALLERDTYSWDVEVMLAIVEGPTLTCPTGESGGDPSAISPDGQNWGLGQVNLIHLWRVDGDAQALLDPATNIRVMHDIYLSQGYQAWSCY